jgi:cell division septum initiation protein DivIVA
MKKFITALTEEVCQLIDKYESKIAALIAENARLKQRPSALQMKHAKTTHSKSPFKIDDEIASPIKKFNGLDMMQTAKSTMFNMNSKGPLTSGQKFSSVLAKYQSKSDSGNFPLELINPEPADSDHRTSRYVAKTTAKKQREE